MQPDFEIAGLAAQDILLKGSCNFLMSLENVKSKIKSTSPVGASVAMVGNWVGGRYALTRTHLHFEMNAMNRRYQDDQSATHIPLETITGFKQGRMMLIAATVDITAANTLYRFRLLPGKHKAMLGELETLCQCADAPF